MFAYVEHLRGIARKSKDRATRGDVSWFSLRHDHDTTEISRRFCILVPHLRSLLRGNMIAIGNQLKIGTLH